MTYIGGLLSYCGRCCRRCASHHCLLPRANTCCLRCAARPAPAARSCCLRCAARPAPARSYRPLLLPALRCAPAACAARGGRTALPGLAPLMPPSAAWCVCLRGVGRRRNERIRLGFRFGGWYILDRLMGRGLHWLSWPSPFGTAGFNSVFRLFGSVRDKNRTRTR